jgi:hypothetical protein
VSGCCYGCGKYIFGFARIWEFRENKTTFSFSRRTVLHGVSFYMANTSLNCTFEERLVRIIIVTTTDLFALRIQWLAVSNGVVYIVYSWHIKRKQHFICRSRWPRGLRHELSSLARTLRSWVLIPLKIWMSVLCAYFLCLCCSVRR